MYVLQKETSPGCWMTVGFFDAFPDAVCAMEAERQKEDSRLRIIQEGEP